jgi:predicted HTH domain antitoxin
MTLKTIEVPVPSDLYAELGNVPSFNGRIKQKLQISLAIGMFVSKEISLSRAAEYAGIALVDFAEQLNGLGIPLVNYTEDMLEDDLEFIRGMQG